MGVILHCLKLQYSAVGNICLVVLCFVFDASASTECPLKIPIPVPNSLFCSHSSDNGTRCCCASTLTSNHPFFATSRYGLFNSMYIRSKYIVFVKLSKLFWLAIICLLETPLNPLYTIGPWSKFDTSWCLPALLNASIASLRFNTWFITQSYL